MPPLAVRPALFCCPVSEKHPDHLPRSFVNPGRHLMNTQLRLFLSCADDAQISLPKCDISHMIEVTTSNLLAPMTSPSKVVQQWNSHAKLDEKEMSRDNISSQVDADMSLDDCEGEMRGPDIQRTTWHSLSTRYFIPQSSGDEWLQPPNSKSFREKHPEAKTDRPERERYERYMEIPPFHTRPYTSESVPGGHSGSASARPWMPSCSIVMWCNKHNQYYEVHTLS